MPFGDLDGPGTYAVQMERVYAGSKRPTGLVKTVKVRASSGGEALDKAEAKNYGWKARISRRID